MSMGNLSNRLKKIESEISKMEAPAIVEYLQRNYKEVAKLMRSNEFQDDGFIEALNGAAKEVWKDYESE